MVFLRNDFFFLNLAISKHEFHHIFSLKNHSVHVWKVREPFCANASQVLQDHDVKLISTNVSKRPVDPFVPFTGLNNA